MLDQHVPLALDLLADMLQHSAFAEDELSREKEVILEEIGMAEDTPEDLIHEMFDAHFFADHPLARSVLGTRSSVLRLGVKTSSILSKALHTRQHGHRGGGQRRP